jgi:uncharacterized membrane protein YccC
LVLWRFCTPARTTASDPLLHPPGWQRRAIIENLTFRSSKFRYALLLGLTGFAAEGIAQRAHFPNAYWVPMIALIIMKPDQLTTNARAIARVAGTLVGAALATLLAVTMRPDGIWLSLLILGSMYLAYALQDVNYAIYAIPLTAYIAFVLAVGHTPAPSTAEHRVVATAIAGAVAMVIHALYVREELRRIAHTLLPRQT